MNKFLLFLFFLLPPVLFSCASLTRTSLTQNSLPPQASLPERQVSLPEQQPQEASFAEQALPPPEQASVVPPPQRLSPFPEKPEFPVYIIGTGKVEGEELALFLEKNNPQADMDFVRVLASHYINEAAYEGVNHDIAFAQMCLETGFLSYGGLVQSEWNNFCGLGAIGPHEPGLVFPDPQIGVRAHIQHLKAYATEEPLFGELVDPRYRFVRKGSSPTIEGLSGTWAADRQYSVKIGVILRRLYEFSF